MVNSSLFANESTIAGTRFTHRGLPVDIRLGAPGDVSCGEFIGSAVCLAPVFGRIDIPKAFVFARAETHLRINGVVGAPAVKASEPVIAFNTRRIGSVGGSYHLEINATIAQFELRDETNPGGLGQKRIIIDGMSERIRVVMRGDANKSTYVLFVSSRREPTALLAVTEGPALTAELSRDGDWVVCTVSSN